MCLSVTCCTGKESRANLAKKDLFEIRLDVQVGVKSGHWLLWVKKLANIAQGSVATHVRCGGIFNDLFITHLLSSLPVKKVYKSIGSWRSYKKEYSYA